MKNEKIVEAWSKIEPSEEAQKRMLKGVLEKVQKAEKSRPVFSWRLPAALLSAGLALVLVFSGQFSLPNKGAFLDKMAEENTLNLPMSDDKWSAGYVGKAPTTNEKADLPYYSEAELVANPATEIYLAEVLNIENIELKAGDYNTYRAIATIEILETIRGDLSKGATTRILLAGPIDREDSYWQEDYQIVAQLRGGINGIFMLGKYAPEESLEIDGAKLYYRDLAEYYFPDGERFAFLLTPQGLQFARYAYPSLVEATDLIAIKDFIIKQIGE